MIRPLPPAAWTVGEAGVTARIALPAGTPCLVWAEGWDEAEAADARAGDEPFTIIARTACAAPVAGAGGIALHAPRVPDRAFAVARAGGAAHASPTLGAGWPRGLLTPRAAPPPAAAPDPALVARLLAAGETDMLLALIGEALLGGAEPAGILDAARAVFLHRARHPLAPDPGLGPLLAALPASDLS